MKRSSSCLSLLILSALSAGLPAIAARAATKSTAPPVKGLEPALFEQAVGRTEDIQLPLNKVHLYRLAAAALAEDNKPEAVALLTRALSVIDTAEVAMRTDGTLDDRALQQLEFGR